MESFVFDDVSITPNRQIRKHSAPSWELSHVIRGRGERTAESRLPRMIELLTMLPDFTESRFAGRGNLLGRAERRLERIRVYCACNYARTITLDEICRYTGMNRSAFCTFMRRHAGVSFTGYVNDLRLARAKEKLARSDESIAETAAECGFSNVTYFNRLFLAKYGITPRQARQRKD